MKFGAIRYFAKIRKPISQQIVPANKKSDTHDTTSMVGESGTSHTGRVHHYYRCVNTKKKKNCTKKAVRKDGIRELVLRYTMQTILNDALMERLIDTLLELQKKESTTLPLLKKQLSEVEKSIGSVLNAVEEGVFTASTKQRLDEMEERKSQLAISILQEEMQKQLLKREQIAFLFTVIENMM